MQIRFKYSEELLFYIVFSLHITSSCMPSCYPKNFLADSEQLTFSKQSLLKGWIFRYPRINHANVDCFNASFATWMRRSQIHTRLFTLAFISTNAIVDHFLPHLLRTDLRRQDLHLVRVQAEANQYLFPHCSESMAPSSRASSCPELLCHTNSVWRSDHPWDGASLWRMPNRVIYPCILAIEPWC